MDCGGNRRRLEILATAYPLRKLDTKHSNTLDMNSPAEQIEFVVREVMRRLAAAPATAASDSTSVAKAPGPCAVDRPSPTTASSNSTTPGQLRVERRVVTTAVFDGRLESISRVVVDAEAIVTPAVIDLLRDKSIELVRGNADVADVRRQVLLVADDNSADTDSIAQQVRTRGLNVRTEVISNCERLGEMLAPNEIGVVLARKPYEASCHANRDDRVCAVFAADSAQCGAALNEVNANVLVVDRKRIDLNVVSSFLDAMGT